MRHDVDVHTKRTDYDEWWCRNCNLHWITKSVPPEPRCPVCKLSGFWQRFLEGEPYFVVTRLTDGM